MPEPSSIVAREIFLELVTLAPPERVALLEARCGTDTSLREAVEQLLADDTEDSFLAESPVAVDPDATIAQVPGSDQSTVHAAGSPGGRVAPGTMVGPYRVEAVLGVGGMGEVYRAIDTRLDRRVALKSIRADRRLGDEARQRFEREARILSSLDHPHICRLYDYFTTLPRDYLVLELIEGEPLDAVRRELSTSDLLRIAEQIARVLAVAHAAGIVHRDLKPENVMVTKDGDAKVLDFGIARPARDFAEPDAEAPEPFDATASAQLFRTSVSGIIGTPMYMSPEQARGADATVASDMYAFGLVLQQLFTGETPYAEPHDLASLLDKARAGELRPISGVRGDIATLIRRLTKAAPSDRLTAVETVAAIKRIRERPQRWLRRGLIAGAIVIASAGTAKYTIDLDQERQVAVEERDAADELSASILNDFFVIAREIGRLDAVEQVGQRVRDYFDQRPAGTVDDEDRFRYATAIGVIGQARLEHEDAWETAHESFEEQIGILAPIVERNPDQGAWRKALGEAFFYLGQQAVWKGDRNSALRHFDTYHANALELVASEPGNPEWKLEVAYALSCRGDMLGDSDRDAAIAAHEESLQIKRDLYATIEGDETLWVGVAESLANGLTYLAAQLTTDETRTADVRRLFEESLSIREELHRRNPLDAERMNKLAIGLGVVGEYLLAEDDAAAALALAERETDLARSLRDNDRANATWRRGLAAAYRRQADCRRALKQEDRALDFYLSAREEWDAVFAEGNDNSDWKAEYRAMSKGYVSLLVAREEWEDLLSFLPQVHALLVRLGVPFDPDQPLEDDADAIDLAKLDLAEGRARAALGEPAHARDLWERSIEWLTPFAEEPDSGKLHYVGLSALAEAHLLLGRPEAAVPYAYAALMAAPDSRLTTLKELMIAADLPLEPPASDG